MSLRTEYEFTLPRGYVDHHGALHRTGRMRLATARDELEPLRDPTVQGADDPRLTILVLSRVVTSLGSVELINAHVIEGLFAVDLAFLQDFYGVINFGDQAEFDALVAASESTQLVGSAPAPGAAEQVVTGEEPSAAAEVEFEASRTAPGVEQSSQVTLPGGSRSSLRHAVEELPRRQG